MEPDRPLTILIVGATGATGRLLTRRLLEIGGRVKAVVRAPERLPAELRDHPRLTLVQGTVLDFDDDELAEWVKDCDGVASCLGHNLSFKGIFGAPRMLVTESVRRLCRALRANRPEIPVRFVLMNTTGNRNRDLSEPISLGQHVVILLLRWLLPPHRDNERAADLLRVEVGQNDAAIEWAAVRPDNLIDRPEATAYDPHASPIRSAIFDAGQTSRINVAAFMAELLANDAVWNEWKGRMPTLYDADV
jgi:nucleoside-diphosphate-sugar epimerase